MHHGFAFRFEGFGFTVWCVGFRVWGLWLGVFGFGVWVLRCVLSALFGHPGVESRFRVVASGLALRV